MPKDNREFDVPENIISAIQEFTKAVLRRRPSNISKFGIEYFTEKVKEQEMEQGLSSIQQPPILRKRSTSETEMINDSTAERLLQEAEKAPPSRRMSVSAEPFNPEDEDEEEVFVIERSSRATSFYEKTTIQTEHIKDVCRRILLFKELDEKELDAVVQAMFMRIVSPSEDIIIENDDGDNFYIIESGQYEAKVMDPETGSQKVVTLYDNEGFFGELALMYNSPRKATITALTDGVLWALSRNSFRRHVLTRAAKRRKQFIELLQSVPILKDLSDYQRMNLADNLQRVFVNEGERIVQEGDIGDSLYFVMDGFVTVKKIIDKTEVQVNRLSKGGYFGELSLISNKPRAASVEAETDVVLAKLGVDKFERLLGPCIDIMKQKALEYKPAKNSY